MSGNHRERDGVRASKRVERVAGGAAAVFLAALVLQAISLVSLDATVRDRALMDSLDWNRTVGVHLDVALHHGHLGCSVLGILAAGMMILSRTRTERLAVVVAAFPVVLSTVAWCAWAVTHLDDPVGRYGLAVIPGLLGLLAGLVCPPAAAWIAASGPTRVEPAWRRVVVFLCALVLGWTVVTLFRTIPIAMAI